MKKIFKKALNVCYEVNNRCVTRLKFTSSYAAPITAANLNTTTLLRDSFNVPVGLSDHTEGFIAPVIAITLEVTIIEKHFILDLQMT